MISTLITSLTALRQDKRGVTAMEYGLIAALVAVAITAGLTSLGEGLTGVFTRITTALS